MAEGSSFEVTARMNIEAGNLEQVAADAEQLANRAREGFRSSGTAAQGAEVKAALAEYQKMLDTAIRGAANLGGNANLTGLTTRIRDMFASVIKDIEEAMGASTGLLSAKVAGAGAHAGAKVKGEGARAVKQHEKATSLAVIAEKKRDQYGGFVDERGRYHTEKGGFGKRPADSTAARPTPKITEVVQGATDMDRARSAADRKRTDSLVRAEGLGIANPSQYTPAYLKTMSGKFEELQGKSSLSTAGMNLTDVETALKMLATSTNEVTEAQNKLASETEAAAGPGRHKWFSSGRVGGGAADSENLKTYGAHDREQGSGIWGTFGSALGGYRRGQGAAHVGGPSGLPGALAGGALFNVGFAIQGGLMSAVSGAVQLDKQFGALKSDVNAMGQGNQFDSMRQSLLGISDATGAAGTDVVQLQEIFLGLTGSVAAATIATKSAAEYIAVTGESAATAGPQIATIMQDFGITSEQASSGAIAAAQASGRGSAAGIAGTYAGAAALTPVAAEFGMNPNQAYGLQAAAQRGSAMSGGDIGSGLARIMENFPSMMATLSQEMPQANFGSNMASNLEQVAKYGKGNYKVTETLGGARNAAVLAGLQQDAQAGQLLGANYTGSGALAKRASAVEDTTGAALTRLKAAVTNVAEELEASGIGTAFTEATAGGAALSHMLGALVHDASALDGAMGGVPGKIAEFALGLGVLNRIGAISGLKKVITLGQKGEAGDLQRGKLKTGIGRIFKSPESRKAEEEASAVDKQTAAIVSNTETVEGSTVALQRWIAQFNESSLAGGVAGEGEREASGLTDVHGNPLSSTGRAAEGGLEGEAGTVGTVATTVVEKTGASGLETAAEVGGESLLLRGGATAAARGAVGDAAGAVPLVGGGLTADVTASSMAGPQGLLVAGAGIAAYAGTTYALDHIIGKNKKYRPETHLTNEGDWVKNPANKDQIGAVAALGTAAQRAALTKDAKSGNLLGFYTLYNQLTTNLKSLNDKQISDLTGLNAKQIADLKAMKASTAPPTPAEKAAASAAAKQAAAWNKASPIGSLPYATSGDVTQAFQSGQIGYAQAAAGLKTVVAQDVGGGTDAQVLAKLNNPTFLAGLSQPVQAQLRSDVQAQAAFAGQQQTTSLANQASFGASIGGENPMAVLNQSLSGFASSLSLTSPQVIAFGSVLATQIAAANTFNLTNTKLGIGAGAASGTPGISAGVYGQSLLTQLLSGQGQTVSGATARRENLALAAQGLGPEFTIKNGVGISKLSDSDLTSGAQTLTAGQQGATTAAIAAAQARQGSQKQLDTIQQAGDQQVLATLLQEQQAHPGVNYQPQIIAAQTKLSQDQLQQQTTALANISAGSSYTQSLQFQSPLAQAQTALGAANQGAAALHTSVAALQALASSQGMGALSGPQQQVLQQWGSAQQQLFQGITSNTQTEISYLQALDISNPLKAATDAIAQLNSEITKQFGTEANLMAQVAAGNPAAITLATQQTAAANTKFQAQQANVAAYYGALQAQAGLTGNAPLQANLGLKAAQAALNAFKAKYPTSANLNNSAYATLYSAVQTAEANSLDTRISFDTNLIQEEVTNNQASIGQAIAQLRVLQAAAQKVGNMTQVESLQTAIQGYINQGNENASFNLPSNLNLPTTYEVRRTEGTPTGGNYYGNTGQVNVNINITNQADIQGAVNTLTKAVGGPPTTGNNLPLH